MSKKELQKTDKKIENDKAKKKKADAPLNKKRSNNKVLKAKAILAKNKAALETLHNVEKAESISNPRKILRIIKNIIFGIVIVALVAAMIVFLVVRMNGGTPSVFGYSVQRITSGSMEPELLVGDIIISKEVERPEDIIIDDIVTFKGGSYFDYNIVTHRVVIPPMQNKDGVYTLTTKGDANASLDPEIEYSSVQSRFLRKSGVLRTFYDFFLSPWGLIIFIAALLIIFFDELLTVVRVMTGNYHEDDDESVGEIMKRLKKEEVEAFLKFQEEQERKRKRRLKHNNTSKKKMKNRKKLVKQSKNTTELDNG